MRSRLSLTITAALGALCLAVTGCSSSSPDAGGGKAELSFLAPVYSDATKGYWQDLITRFEQAHPDITVNLEMAPWTDISQKLNTLVSTQQQPDIVNYNSFATFAADDLLLPMKDVLPEATASDMLPNLTGAGTYDGEVYGMPMLASVRAMFYNKTLFAKAGIAAPPKTWDELLSAAEKIAATGNAGWGIAYAGKAEMEADLSGFMWNNGGDWKTDGKWTVDAPKNVQALQFMQDLVGKYKVTQPGGSSAQREDVWRLFGQGKIGMIQGSNFLPAVLKAQGGTVDYGVAPMPTNGGAAPASLAVQDYLLAFKSTEHKAEVGEFLSFFYEADNYSRFLANEGMLPVTASATEKIPTTQPTQVPFVGLLPSSKFYPSTDPAWATVQDETRTSLGQSVGGQVSPADALAKLQSVAQNG